MANWFSEFIKFDVLVNEHGNGAGKAGIDLKPIVWADRNAEDSLGGGCVV